MQVDNDFDTAGLEKKINSIYVMDLSGYWITEGISLVSLLTQ